MRTITIRQLIDLVEGGSPSSESCIQKVFEWQFERNISVVRWALGVAASLAIAITASYFSSEQVVSAWEFGFGLFFSFLSATYGVYILVRLRLISTQFTAAVSLYSKLKRIDEFILKYRR
jgi:hypothetical protein